MNRVIMIGRLTRDPDIRYSQNDQSMAIARYTLAVDRRVKKEEGQQTADFIGCVAFGKGAEFAEKYLHKGTKIAVTGRIQTGSYTNRDGQKVYTTDVVVEDHEFVESKAAQEQAQGQPQQAAMQGQPIPQQGTPQATPPQAAPQQAPVQGQPQQGAPQQAPAQGQPQQGGSQGQPVPQQGTPAPDDAGDDLPFN